MKLCTQQQILNWMNVTLSKIKKLHWTDSEFDRTYFLYFDKLTGSHLTTLDDIRNDTVEKGVSRYYYY